MHVYPFEKLEVWQLARKLVGKIYQMTEKFPSSERYGMVSQMRRSALSVCSNLAEGAGRYTSKDQAHFYTQGYGSLMELLNQLIISSDLKWLSVEEYSNLRSDVETISRGIYNLRFSILNPKPN